MSEEEFQVIGIDAATQQKDTGLARATVTRSDEEEWSGKVHEVGRGSEREQEDVVSHLREWLSNSDRTLVAIDAPLGWPHDFRELLQHHDAGQPLQAVPGLRDTDEITEICDAFFFRYTDRWIAGEVLENRPMSVCADRIARASYSILYRLDQLDGHDLSLVESREELQDGPGVIEVYPKATLTVMNQTAQEDLLERSYKSNEQPRRKIVEVIENQDPEFDITGVADEIKKNDDELDAVISALGGFDFLRGDVWTPGEVYGADVEGLDWPDDESDWREIVEREGWIWCRNPGVVAHEVSAPNLRNDTFRE